ncbi:MAG: DHH family phosphoesterase [Candidatus Micrarchaeota archaeon]
MGRKLIDYLEDAHEELEGESGAKKEPLAAEGPPQQDIDAFVSFAKLQGKRVLDTFKEALIVNHFDCDGITSGSITALALKSRNIPFKMLTVKKMDDSVINAARDDSSNYVIFVDIGTGFLNQLNGLAKQGKSIVQIDHHSPEKIDSKSDGLILVNCHNFNIDGAFYACSSSTAYFTFAENTVVEQAKKMAELGIVGAVGDVQDSYGLRGPNRLMLEEAKKIKVVTVLRDLKLFGRVSRTLVNFLNYSSEPFLPSLTGNPKNCALFLKRNHVPLFREEDGKRIWLRYYDLSKEERLHLIGSLINFCIEKRISEDAIKWMIGDVYLFPHENSQTELYDAYEFSSMLNACGRSGKPDAGVRLCMAEPEAYEEARALLQQHRIEISKGIAFARKYAEDMGAFYLLDGRKAISDSVIGTVAGSYFNSGSIPREKPILALSIDENSNIKASGRGWKGLIEKGLDLGKIMNVSSKEAGGFGGGHSVAAGASFPNTDEALRKFLLRAKKEIRQQLG